MLQAIVGFKLKIKTKIILTSFFLSSSLQQINVNFNDYLTEVLKYKWYGSFLELKALGYRYKRNIILFEAFNTGTWFVREKKFKSAFRVFFTPEKHFDSIFKINYIEKAAFCQGLSIHPFHHFKFNLISILNYFSTML